jgi:hypothetical protein
VGYRNSEIDALVRGANPLPITEAVFAADALATRERVWAEAQHPARLERPRRGRGVLRRRSLFVAIAALIGVSSAGAYVAALGEAPPERAGVHFPGAARSYDLPVAALNGASPDGYETLAEADGIIAAERSGTAPGERCVVIASASGATTQGCWQGELKPGALVWAFDEADGSQTVAFATDSRAAGARVGQRMFPVAAGSDIAVTRLQKGETLPIQVRQGTTGYTVAFPGGTARR